MALAAEDVCAEASVGPHLHRALSRRWVLAFQTIRPTGRDEMVDQANSMYSSPPGPRYLNPFRILRDMWDPTALMLETRDRYGHTYRLPTILGPVVVTGDPEGVRAIFTA